MDTIKQKSVAVTLGDGTTVEVRRMKWKATRDLLKKFSAIAIQFVPKPWDKKEGEEKEPFNLIGILPKILNESDELVAHIMKSSTSLTAEQADNLDALDALKVLEAAFDVNYDEELKNFLAGTVAKLAVLVPTRAAPTTS